MFLQDFAASFPSLSLLLSNSIGVYHTNQLLIKHHFDDHAVYQIKCDWYGCNSYPFNPIYTHEQQRKQSAEDYQKYFDHFDPDLYNPSTWAQEAKNAGMKYFVVTTKHHDGFCLWDSALTDYKATTTPAKRDLLKPMVQAFRNEGLKVGFYH